MDTGHMWDGHGHKQGTPGPPGAAEAVRSLLWRCWGCTALPIPYFGACGLQNSERVNSYRFKPLSFPNFVKAITGSERNVHHTPPLPSSTPVPPSSLARSWANRCNRRPAEREHHKMGTPQGAGVGRAWIRLGGERRVEREGRRRGWDGLTTWQELGWRHEAVRTTGSTGLG